MLICFPKTVQKSLTAYAIQKHPETKTIIIDPAEMLWALTTRFQADKNLYTYPDSLGSSLDPSSEPGEDRRLKCKAGFDCIIPLSKNRVDFEKVH